VASKTARGLAAALAAYTLWGILPFYMKAVAHIPVWEVVAHRAIWSLPTAGLILLFLGRTQDIARAITSPKIISMLCLTSLLVSANWIGYIWAVTNDRALDAALGYYISPLFNVLAGFLFLQEKLNRYQWGAVFLAFLAVLLLSINGDGVPWLALFLAASFALYGLLRKTLPIGAAQGFTVEILILFMPALLLEGFFVVRDESHFFNPDGFDLLLLLLGGPLTALPLILYATGARALNLATIGLMQYTTPSFLFLVAIFLFGEPFSTIQLMAFILIWIGLAVYSFFTLKEAHREAKNPTPAPTPPS